MICCDHNVSIDCWFGNSEFLSAQTKYKTVEVKCVCDGWRAQSTSYILAQIPMETVYVTTSLDAHHDNNLLTKCRHIFEIRTFSPEMTGAHKYKSICIWIPEEIWKLSKTKWEIAAGASCSSLRVDISINQSHANFPQKHQNSQVDPAFQFIRLQIKIPCLSFTHKCPS